MIVSSSDSSEPGTSRPRTTSAAHDPAIDSAISARMLPLGMPSGGTVERSAWSTIAAAPLSASIITKYFVRHRGQVYRRWSSGRWLKRSPQCGQW